MKSTPRFFSAYIVSFLVLSVVLVFLNIFSPIISNILITPTSSPTISPPPDLSYRAIVIIQTGCYDWSNRLLAILNTYELVEVLGKNKDGSWYITRAANLQFSCWVKSEDLKLANFTPENLAEILEPFPQSEIPTSIFTLSIVPTNTATNHVISAQTIQPTGTPTAKLTLTATPCNRPATPILTSSLAGQNLYLSWNLSQNALVYEIFRSISDADYISLGSTPQTSFRDTLLRGLTQSYYVIASNSCGDSNPSNIVTVTR